MTRYSKTSGTALGGAADADLNSFLRQKTRGRRFDVEATDRVTTSDGLLRGDIIQGVPDHRESIVRPVMFATAARASRNHGERPVAEDIDLDEPGTSCSGPFPTGRPASPWAEHSTGT